MPTRLHNFNRITITEDATRAPPSTPTRAADGAPGSTVQTASSAPTSCGSSAAHAPATTAAALQR